MGGNGRGGRRGQLKPAVGLTLFVGTAVKRQQLPHDPPHPLRAGVSGALVVVNDGTHGTAKDDVARQPGVGA